MKIAVYTICRNESKHVDRFMDCCEQADGVFILDTGSEDDSVLRLRNRGAIVNQAIIDPWRFDTARNMNLDMVPDDYDICVSIDLDEVIMPCWREHLEYSWMPGITRANYWYADNQNYENPDPNPHFFRHHKIHSRRGYHWKYAIHEELFATIPENECWTQIKVVHYPDRSKSRAEYLGLIEQVLREDPSANRHRIYMMIELIRHRRYSEAIDFVNDYLQMKNCWGIDRSYMCMLAASVDLKMHWLMRAAVEAPTWREPWFELAKHFAEIQSYSSALVAAENAISLEERVWVSYSNQIAWGPEVYRLLAECQLNVGLRNEAKSTLLRGCRAFSDDTTLPRMLGELIS